MKVFYHEVPGFPIYRGNAEWIEMNVGATLLILRKRGRPYDGAKLSNSAGIQLAFRVTPAQVEECHQELLQKQVEILDPPRGSSDPVFKDPEGNILEIYADI